MEKKLNNLAPGFRSLRGLFFQTLSNLINFLMQPAHLKQSRTCFLLINYFQHSDFYSLAQIEGGQSPNNK